MSEARDKGAGHVIADGHVHVADHLEEDVLVGVVLHGIETVHVIVAEVLHEIETVHVTVAEARHVIVTVFASVAEVRHVIGLDVKVEAGAVPVGEIVIVMIVIVKAESHCEPKIQPRQLPS